MTDDSADSLESSRKLNHRTSAAHADRIERVADWSSFLLLQLIILLVVLVYQIQEPSMYNSKPARFKNTWELRWWTPEVFSVSYDRLLKDDTGRVRHIDFSVTPPSNSEAFIRKGNDAGVASMLILSPNCEAFDNSGSFEIHVTKIERMPEELPEELEDWQETTFQGKRAFEKRRTDSSRGFGGHAYSVVFQRDGEWYRIDRYTRNVEDMPKVFTECFGSFRLETAQPIDESIRVPVTEGTAYPTTSWPPRVRDMPPRWDSTDAN